MRYTYRSVCHDLPGWVQDLWLHDRVNSCIMFMSQTRHVRRLFISQIVPSIVGVTMFMGFGMFSCKCGNSVAVAVVDSRSTNPQQKKRVSWSEHPIRAFVGGIYHSFATNIHSSPENPVRAPFIEHFIIEHFPAQTFQYLFSSSFCISIFAKKQFQ